MKVKRNFLARIALILSILFLTFSIIPQAAFGKAHDPNQESYDYGLRFWEDQQPDIGFYINAASRYTLETVQAPNMGSTFGEWSVMNILRGMYTGYDYMNYIEVYDDEKGSASGYKYFDDYLDRIENYVANKNGNLDRNKSTEWSRLILALSALDYDITDVAGYDFIEKLSESHQFSYRQGINGPIWEIIAMNTGKYNFYPNAGNKNVNTYGKMIDYILSLEIEQSDGTLGGWSLANFGNTLPDPDITAMALQALAPYYNNETLYNESRAMTSFVEFEEAVERAIYILSDIQADNGAFMAFNNVNAESTVQVIVALTELGFDPVSNIELPRINKTAKFIKKDGAKQDGVWTNNMIDALLTFWADRSGSGKEGVGGFKHVTTGDDGGGGSGYGVNSMATDQSLYGLIAYDRFLKDENTLYDMTDMMSRHNGTKYNELRAKKHTLNYITTKDESLKKVHESPYAVIDIAKEVENDGYIFSSWNTEKNGKGTAYEPNEKLSMPDHDITLYAQYEAINYKIEYELDGGEFINDVPEKYSIEDEIVLPIADQLGKEGYVFDGWYDNKNLSGEAITTIEIGTYGDQTFYAKWKEVSDIDQEAVDIVIDLFNELPDIAELTINDKEKVKEARAAYNKLTEKEQKLVTNLDRFVELEQKLIKLEEEYRDQIAAEQVSNMIDRLASVEVVALDDKEAIVEARKAYENLTDTQQLLVINIDKLIELESKINELQEAYDLEKASEVDSMIQQLPSLEDLTIENKEQVDKIRNLFYNLTPVQKDLLKSLDQFNEIEAKMFELEEIEADEIEADKVQMQIEGLPSISELNLNDKASVQIAREAYDRLTDAQKELVLNLELLKVAEEKITSLEKEVADQTAANEVMNAINYYYLLIDDLTLDDKDDINHVVNEYEKLTEDQKQLVTIKEKLDELLEKIIAMEKAVEQADKKVGEEIETIIKNLPSLDKVTIDDKASVSNARKKHEKLTEQQKQHVNNLESLVALENRLEILSGAKDVEKMIEELPSVENLTLSDKEKVTKAKDAYEKLSDEQKKYVANVEQIKILEEKIEELQKEDNEAKENEDNKGNKEDKEQGGVNSSEGDKPALGNDKDSEEKKKNSKDSNKNVEKNSNTVKDQDQINNNSEKEESNELPKTATNLFNILLIGFTLIVLGSVMYFIRKKKTI